ncbi:hypothetical protein [Pedobacter mendelii]|uniref:Uncharacterized protein n=1 Tax=Pedobacter mendelii TaxID=1908240 RepID=A0ABQ2BC48_9SPHI|nr:hypothetical protein [Pedobacter mendelii]GGI22529.1 hypothetical protein GCM10008119_03100 [Pedobacter mendelii]
MDTLIIEVTDKKAYKLLMDLEELHLIKVIKKSSEKLSSLRLKIKSPMDNADIDKQLNQLRDEWTRDI